MIALSRNMNSHQGMIVMILLLGYLITICIGIPSYINVLSVNMVLGITAIVFTWQGAAIRKISFGWLFAVIVLLLFYVWVPSKFVLYIAIGMAVFSLMESAAGRAGRLALFALVLMSPLCEYFTNVFGFPIRLQLTQMAGFILHVIDKGFRIEGNSLRNGNTEFSIDAACMGLHMLISSLLTGLILLGIYQRRLKKKLPLIWLTIVSIAILFFNLFSNLVRIIALVEFQVLPENNMHATIGLVCFLIYVLLPSVVLVKFTVRRFGFNHDWQTGNLRLTPKEIAAQFLLLIVIFGIAFAGRNRTVNQYLQTGTVKAPGYKIENLGDAIVKLSTDKGLIYLKPILGFYSSDHQPTMCWKGSGYEFRKLVTLNLDGQMIYTSTLEKGSDKLYTAWWYDNGDLKTISQFTWRWDSFKHNRPWVLVNVTADSEPELFKQIRQIRRINPCRMLLNPG